jgi:hypothetical protein
MQIDASIAAFSSGNDAFPIMTRHAGSKPAVSGLTASTAPTTFREDFHINAALTELPTQPIFTALASDGSSGTSVFRESTGSGNAPVKIAASLYALNLSFDIQALALDLLA